MDALFTLFLQCFFTVFIGASLAKKLWNPSAFVGVVKGYRLLPPRLESGLASGLAVMVMTAEALCLLMLLVWPAWGGMAVAGLIGFYGTAIAINVIRGHRDFDCGCLWHFGAKAPPTTAPRQLIWLFCRNGGAVAFALGLVVASSLATKADVSIDAILLCGAAAIFFNMLVLLTEMLIMQPSLINPAQEVAHG